MDPPMSPRGVRLREQRLAKELEEADAASKNRWGQLRQLVTAPAGQPSPKAAAPLTFPDVLGPFAPIPIPEERLPSMEAGRDYWCLPPSAAGDASIKPVTSLKPPLPLRGRCAPAAAITLPQEDWEMAGIPARAKEFLWGFPIDAPLPTAVQQALDPALPLSGFLLFGGFMYIDGQNKVVGVNCIKPGPGMGFAAPRRLPDRVADALREGRRLQPITIAFLRDKGARHFAWLNPADPLFSEAKIPHGAFAYVFQGGDNMYFECAGADLLDRGQSGFHCQDSSSSLFESVALKTLRRFQQMIVKQNTTAAAAFSNFAKKEGGKTGIQRKQLHDMLAWAFQTQGGSAKGQKGQDAGQLCDKIFEALDRCNDGCIGKDAWIRFTETLSSELRDRSWRALKKQRTKKQKPLKAGARITVTTDFTSKDQVKLKKVQKGRIETIDESTDGQGARVKFDDHAVAQWISTLDYEKLATDNSRRSSVSEMTEVTEDSPDEKPEESPNWQPSSIDSVKPSLPMANAETQTDGDGDPAGQAAMPPRASFPGTFLAQESLQRRDVEVAEAVATEVMLAIAEERAAGIDQMRQKLGDLRVWLAHTTLARGRGGAAAGGSSQCPHCATFSAVMAEQSARLRELELALAKAQDAAKQAERTLAFVEGTREDAQKRAAEDATAAAAKAAEKKAAAKSSELYKKLKKSQAEAEEATAAAAAVAEQAAARESELQREVADLRRRVREAAEAAEEAPVAPPVPPATAATAPSSTPTTAATSGREDVRAGTGSTGGSAGRSRGHPGRAPVQPISCERLGAARDAAQGDAPPPCGAAPRRAATRDASTTPRRPAPPHSAPPRWLSPPPSELGPLLGLIGGNVDAPWQRGDQPRPPRPHDAAAQRPASAAAPGGREPAQRPARPHTARRRGDAPCDAASPPRPAGDAPPRRVHQGTVYGEQWADPRRHRGTRWLVNLTAEQQWVTVDEQYVAPVHGSRVEKGKQVYVVLPPDGQGWSVASPAGALYSPAPGYASSPERIRP